MQKTMPGRSCDFSHIASFGTFDRGVVEGPCTTNGYTLAELLVGHTRTAHRHAMPLLGGIVLGIGKPMAHVCVVFLNTHDRDIRHAWMCYVCLRLCSVLWQA